RRWPGAGRRRHRPRDARPCRCDRDLGRRRRLSAARSGGQGERRRRRGLFRALDRPRGAGGDGRSARSRSRRHHRTGGAGAPARHGRPSRCPATAAGRCARRAVRFDRSRPAAGPPAGPGLARRRVVELAREMTPAGTLLTLDVPLAAAWQSVAPRECLVANGAATLGFALPAALAAALARPDARVVAVGAAAGFAAMAGEWRTAARLRAPSVAVALNHAGTTDVASGARAAGVDVETAT